MMLAQCKGCGSQFDVSSMEAGSSFICGKCGKPVEVPKVLQPVVQPIQPSQKGRQNMPATVVLTPNEMKQALRESREQEAAAPAQKPAAAAKAASPKLPKAMQKRAQAKGGGGAPARAGGAQKAAAAGPEGGTKRPTKARSGTAKKPAARPAAKQSAASTRAAAPAGGGGSRRSSSGGRSDRRGGGREERAPAAKKSNTGLFIGIGAVALIGVVVGVLALGNKDEPEVPATAGTEGAANVAPGVGAVGAVGTAAAVGTAPIAGSQASTVPAAGTGTGTATVEAALPKDEFETFASLSADEQWVQALTRLDTAKGNAGSLEAAYEWFKNPKLAASAKASAAAEIAAVEALKLDTSLVWAMTALGKENGKAFLETLMAECAMAFSVPEETEVQVRAELAKLEDDPWVDAKGLRRLELLAKKVRDRQELISGDER